MDTLVKADIFFFITAVSVIVLTALLIVSLVYISRILKNVLFISRKAKEETEKLSNDVESVRRRIKKDSSEIRSGGKEILNNAKKASNSIKRNLNFSNTVAFFLNLFRINRGSNIKSKNKRAYGKKKNSRKKADK